MSKRIIIPTEDEEMATVVDFLRLRGFCFHHSPNGGKRPITTAKRMKRLGTFAGFPDLIILDPPKGHVGTAIELKRLKGGTVSTDQRKWLEKLKERGWHVAVCRGAGEAIDLIERLY